MAGGIAELLGKEEEKKLRRERRSLLNPPPRTSGFLRVEWRRARPPAEPKPTRREV